MIENWDEQVHDLHDEYTLLGELAFGEHALVYRARHRARGREVMIRVLPAGAPTEERLARLQSAEDSVARLQHESVIPLHAIHNLDDGSVALVMPRMSLRTLRQALELGGPFKAEQVERLLVDVTNTLSYAERQGLVHQQLTPDSIFIELESGRTMLGDFAIERALGPIGSAFGDDVPAYFDYAAPEQQDGSLADGRSNLYSLGLVAWELLTGRRIPCRAEGNSLADTLPSIEALRPDKVPLRLQYVVERMLRNDPLTRFAGAHALLSSLKAWVAPADWQDWETSFRARSLAESSSGGHEMPALLVSDTPLPFERLTPSSHERLNSIPDVVESAADPALEGVVRAAPPEFRRPRLPLGLRNLVAKIPFWRQAVAGLAIVIVIGGFSAWVWPMIFALFGVADESDTGRDSMMTKLVKTLRDPNFQMAALGIGLVVLTGVVPLLNLQKHAKRLRAKAKPIEGGLLGPRRDDGELSVVTAPAIHPIPLRITPDPRPTSERRPVRPRSTPSNMVALAASRAATWSETGALDVRFVAAEKAAIPAPGSGVTSLGQLLGAVGDGHVVHYGRPGDSGLPELQGRLVIASGFDNGREIRFVKSPGPDGSQVTFGQSYGDKFRHVRLEDDTLSGVHARMELIEERWHLINLARTNSVVLNGEVMTMGQERALNDGDAIAMGEVLFTFQSH